MANDRNGLPIAVGTDYVLIGDAIKETGDGRVLINTGRQVVPVEAAKTARVASLGGGGSNDHGALTGLADDDHTQYHTDARGDARYSQLGHTHAQLHDPATVADSSSIDLSITGQQISAAAIFGTTAGTVCQGNDSRLSDARTPTAHGHSGADITSGTVPSARLPDATSGAKGAVIIGTGSSSTVPTMGDHQDTEDLASAGLPIKFTSGGLVPGLAGKQPLDALLTAVAALVTAADKIAYFTGVDTVALTDFTSAARTFCSAADAAAQRSALGLGSAATLNAGVGLGDLPTVATCIAAFAGIAHAHAASDVTSGVFVPARLYTLVATLASNAATAANTTPISLTGLVWTFDANATYLFEWHGRVQPAAATTGCGFQLDVSAAVTEISMQFYHQLASTGTLSGGHSVADDASVGVSSGMPGTSGYPVTGHGMLRTSGSSGTAQLRFRSETTAVITALAGMTLLVRKVA